jgi:peptidoglycan/LPS O-acetylase OafA/YrhL
VQHWSVPNLKADKNDSNDRQLPLLRPHMPELDTLRGIAVLGVIFYHGLYWVRDLSPYKPWQRISLAVMSPGQFGVNLFFVLSGFLITGILLESRNRPDYYRRFYYRRALRILPAYYFTLLLLILFHMTSRGFLLMSLLFSSNLSELFGIPISYFVLWSLAVEEHFYFFWPAILRRLSLRTLEYGLIAVVILTPVARYLHYQEIIRMQVLQTPLGIYTWDNLDGLALGAIVAILIRQRNWGRKQVLQFSILLSVLVSVIVATGSPYGILTRRTALGASFQQELWTFFFAALLGFFLVLGSGPWKRWVAPSVLIFYGNISYGLYLYHLMVFGGYDWMVRKTNLPDRLHLGLWTQAWTRMIIVGGVATLAAYLSRRYLENPFLHLKDKMPSRQKS